MRFYFAHFFFDHCVVFDAIIYVNYLFSNIIAIVSFQAWNLRASYNNFKFIIVTRFGIRFAILPTLHYSSW